MHVDETFKIVKGMLARDRTIELIPVSLKPLELHSNALHYSVRVGEAGALVFNIDLRYISSDGNLLESICTVQLND